MQKHFCKIKPDPSFKPKTITSKTYFGINLNQIC